ncbi:Plp1p [Nakaseomyces bracarensis]|uniref:Plp1p n=1 Tax=Nakaseomyces bracarensis TaxID=273131 RepID=UPI0038722A14
MAELKDKGSLPAGNESDENIDEILEELELEDSENDLFMSRYRESRLQEIHNHFYEVKKKEQEGYGKLNEIAQESELMKLTTKNARVVIHFQLEKFPKCRYMNEKLEQLSGKYIKTKFFKINVENAPFLVEKLAIKVLPFVICYINGSEAERIIGFSKMGNDPNGFRITQLESVLLKAGVIERNPIDVENLKNYRNKKGDYDDEMESYSMQNRDSDQEDSDLDI